jgi:hypothetical protein
VNTLAKGRLIGRLGRPVAIPLTKKKTQVSHTSASTVFASVRASAHSYNFRENQSDMLAKFGASRVKLCCHSSCVKSESSDAWLSAGDNFECVQRVSTTDKELSV